MSGFMTQEPRGYLEGKASLSLEKPIAGIKFFKTH